jgi:Flp pilus assembly protein TadB
LELVRPDISVGAFYGECTGTAAMFAAIPVVAWAMSQALAGSSGPIPMWFSLVLFPAGFALPYFRLSKQLKARETRILMAMPTLLDLLSMHLVAGDTVQRALREVAREGDDELSRELGRALTQTALGGGENSLPSVLEDMARRNAINELSVFVAQVRVNDALGISPLDTLNAQSESLREWKRLRIVEAGGKASTKIVIPLLLIVPVLFVLVLLPAASQLLGAGL